MKDLRTIRNFIEQRISTEKLVLCTLVRKQGSSYRSLGAKKIIALSGESVGLLSGGCLEASIVKSACTRYAELPFIETFDMLAEEDRLLGYQTGCQGSIDVLFEALPKDDFEIDLYLPYGVNPPGAGVCVSLEIESLGKREIKNHISRSANTLFEAWVEPIQLVIVGCGADADAYAPLAEAMGWEIVFLDYRSDLTTQDRFSYGQVVHAPLATLAAHIPQGPRVAVVLMTHNYESDMEILKSMGQYRIGYLGCLGPQVRFVKMQKDLLAFHDCILSPQLLQVAHAPAGIFAQSRSPEEIALAVIAQIQGELVEQAHGHVWTLILAAGASQRFGGIKALAAIDGETFIARALQTASDFSGTNALVVVGAHAEALAPHLNHVRSVFNVEWNQGMGTSIACGIQKIQELDPAAEGIVILPVDQPFVTSAHLQNLTDLGKRSNRCALTASDEASGPPAYIPKTFFAAASSLRGDHGLKSQLRATQMVHLESPTDFIDIDKPDYSL